MSKVRQYHDKVKTILPGGVFYNFNMPWEEIPLHFSDSRGSRVFDMDGKEYLDLYARFGATILGHNNQEYFEALQSANRVLCVSHTDFDYDALELINRFVPGAEMVRFGLSGTEIVQLALRIARAYTGKNKFVRFDNHYHGGADNIMGGQSNYPKDFGIKEPRGDMRGTAGRAQGILQEQSYILPWNDLSALDELLVQDQDIACVITEPVCANGGSILPQDGFLQGLRNLCDKHGVVLIFDEMITGFRMGLGGAQAHYGVTPDLTTLGKALSGGGLPVSAVAGKAHIMQLLADKTVAFPGTYNGYPLGTAAVKATIDILSRDNGAAYDSMFHHTNQLHELLQDAANQAEIELVIQGPPGLASFHCSPKELTTPSAYTYDIMMNDIVVNATLQKHGILISTVSRIYPNISLNQSDVAFFRDRIYPAMEEAKMILTEIA